MRPPGHEAGFGQRDRPCEVPGLEQHARLPRRRADRVLVVADDRAEQPERGGELVPCGEHLELADHGEEHGERRMSTRPGITESPQPREGGVVVTERHEGVGFDAPGDRLVLGARGAACHLGRACGDVVRAARFEVDQQTREVGGW